MKIYIQNGHNKIVCTTKKPLQTIKEFVKGLIVTTVDGDEVVELSPVICTSQCGFLSDLKEMNMFDEIDKMRFYKTEKILRSIGRKDIADWIKKMPVDAFTKKMLGNIA